MDLNKKRKVSEMTSATTGEKLVEKVVEQPVEPIPSSENAASKVEKPWEKEAKEEEDDYRWNICENCQ